MAEFGRIMWIESKVDGLSGPARIGRVMPARGRALRYGDKKFQTLRGSGFKANYYDVETGDEYWISGCHRDGKDALYSTTVEIDEDVREEYCARSAGARIWCTSTLFAPRASTAGRFCGRLCSATALRRPPTAVTAALVPEHDVARHGRSNALLLHDR
jgi:hypothetical protein